MSDLISRGEVENVLHNNLHALIDTDQLYQLYKDINRLPTYPIPNSAENKREWIPTIERLPKIGDTVLCSVKTPECTQHHIIICKYCAEEFWKDGTIRAWQPLPEPYKKESEDI